MKKQNKTNHKPQRHLRTEGSLSLPPAPVKTRFCRKDVRASPWVVSVRELPLTGCSDLPVGLAPPRGGREPAKGFLGHWCLGPPVRHTAPPGPTPPPR